MFESRPGVPKFMIYADSENVSVMSDDPTPYLNFTSILILSVVTFLQAQQAHTWLSVRDRTDAAIVQEKNQTQIHI